VTYASAMMRNPIGGPGAQIPISTLPNFRDLGGWPTADGAVTRHGVLYRSAALDALVGADLETFSRYRIAQVFDLRTRGEREAQPDVASPGATYRILDVLQDSINAGPARLLEVITDPGAAEELLGDGQAVQIHKERYRELIHLPSARECYRQLLTEVASVGATPAVFHCSTGKDRTGWAAALLLLIAGVSEEDVVDEYLLTNEQLLPAYREVFEQFASAGGEPALLEPVIGVRPEYLRASLAAARNTYGSFDLYLANGLGVDRETLATLRSVLVDRS